MLTNGAIIHLQLPKIGPFPMVNQNYWRLRNSGEELIAKRDDGNDYRRSAVSAVAGPQLGGKAATRASAACTASTPSKSTVPFAEVTRYRSFPIGSACGQSPENGYPVVRLKHRTKSDVYGRRCRNSGLLAASRTTGPRLRITGNGFGRSMQVTHLSSSDHTWLTYTSMPCS